MDDIQSIQHTGYEEQNNIKQKYAFVYLLMGGDRFLPALMVSLYSLLKQNPKHDIVVMVTQHISLKVRKFLRSRGVLLEEIKELAFKSKKSSGHSKRSKIKQSPIIPSKSYTKWNCMKLIQYEKVLYLDANTIILANIDNIFELNTPAGCFSNNHSKKSNICEYYDNMMSNQLVPRENIIKGLFQWGFVFDGTPALITPNQVDYLEFINTMKRTTKNGEFGFNCFSGVSEQSITYYYSVIKQQDFYNIAKEYNIVPWKNNWENRNQWKIVHYFGKEIPNEVPPDKWDDLKLFYHVADDMIFDWKIGGYETLFPYMSEFDFHKFRRSIDSVSGNLPGDAQFLKDPKFRI